VVPAALRQHDSRSASAARTRPDAAGLAVLLIMAFTLTPPKPEASNTSAGTLPESVPDFEMQISAELALFRQQMPSPLASLITPVPAGFDEELVNVIAFKDAAFVTWTSCMVKVVSPVPLNCTSTLWGEGR
jgi:hypothetical protein